MMINSFIFLCILEQIIYNERIKDLKKVIIKETEMYNFFFLRQSLSHCKFMISFMIYNIQHNTNFLILQSL